jgi:hypothetical protein
MEGVILKGDKISFENSTFVPIKSVGEKCKKTHVHWLSANADLSIYGEFDSLTSLWDTVGVAVGATYVLENNVLDFSPKHFRLFFAQLLSTWKRVLPREVELGEFIDIAMKSLDDSQLRFAFSQPNFISDHPVARDSELARMMNNHLDKATGNLTLEHPIKIDRPLRELHRDRFVINVWSIGTISRGFYSDDLPGVVIGF